MGSDHEHKIVYIDSSVNNVQHSDLSGGKVVPSKSEVPEVLEVAEVPEVAEQSVKATSDEKNHISMETESETDTETETGSEQNKKKEDKEEKEEEEEEDNKDPNENQNDDTMSMASSSTDSSIATIDILKVDPLYFRLNCFLKSKNGNCVADLLEKTIDLLENICNQMNVINSTDTSEKFQTLTHEMKRLSDNLEKKASV